MDRKENQFRNSKYSKQYKKAYEEHQGKTSRISRPCDEKGKTRAFVDNRKDRRKKKQRSSKNKNTRRNSSLAGKKHCGDVCGCKRSQKVEGRDRLRLQQTRQLMMMNYIPTNARPSNINSIVKVMKTLYETEKLVIVSLVSKTSDLCHTHMNN